MFAGLMDAGDPRRMRSSPPIDNNDCLKSCTDSNRILAAWGPTVRASHSFGLQVDGWGWKPLSSKTKRLPTEGASVNCRADEDPFDAKPIKLEVLWDRFWHIWRGAHLQSQKLPWEVPLQWHWPDLVTGIQVLALGKWASKLGSQGLHRQCLLIDTRLQYTPTGQKKPWCHSIIKNWAIPFQQTKLPIVAWFTMDCSRCYNIIVEETHWK